VVVGGEQMGAEPVRALVGRRQGAGPLAMQLPATAVTKHRGLLRYFLAFLISALFF